MNCIHSHKIERATLRKLRLLRLKEVGVECILSLMPPFVSESRGRCLLDNSDIVDQKLANDRDDSRG